MGLCHGKMTGCSFFSWFFCVRGVVISATLNLNVLLLLLLVNTILESVLLIFLLIIIVITYTANVPLLLGCLIKKHFVNIVYNLLRI